jgi:hypothetical protein
MSYSFVHTQRPQFPLRVLFLVRTDAHEDACPLSDGGCDRKRIRFVASQRASVVIRAVLPKMTAETSRR